MRRRYLAAEAEKWQMVGWYGRCSKTISPCLQNGECWMHKQLRLFDLPTQEYKNKVGSTVFEISGTLNELRSIYKDIRRHYLQTRNTITQSQT